MQISLPATFAGCLLVTSLIAMETGDSETALHNAALHGDTVKVADLLQKNQNINAQTPLGKTPAHKAIYADPVEGIIILRLLKMFGADLNIPDAEGSTPLHLAVRNESWFVVTELEKLGCNREIKDKNGHTPDDLKSIVGLPQLAKHYLQNPNSLTKEYLAHFKGGKRVTFK